jgi:divalent metal cation (Fe/Co/Zn/Cd) transporter
VRDAVCVTRSQVDPKLSASTAHHLAEEVRSRVLSEAAEPIAEVLVHVDVMRHDATCPLQNSVLGGRRHHADVEAEVATRLQTLPEVVSVPRVRVYYLEEGVSVEAHARVLEHLTVAQLRAVAARGRELLLRDSPALTDVLISVDLTPPPADEIADEIVATSRSAQEAELAASG